MKNKVFRYVMATMLLMGITAANAQEKIEYKTVPVEITTPEKVNASVGKLSFPKGYPTEKTSQILKDEMIYIHGIESFINSIQGVSLWALRNGFAEFGIQDNEFIVFPEMMDSKSLFLTANADTYYFWGNVNLIDGPMIVETPPNTLGIFDDFWFRHISDFGLPGPDRGMGGKYLLIPPGYEGELPTGVYNVVHSRTYLVTVLGRAFLEDNSPAKAIESVEKSLKVYEYTPGGIGTTVADYLDGKAKLGPVVAEPKNLARLVDGTGMQINTIPPNDFGHYEFLNEMVQYNPASALDPELAGQFAAIGIVKGKEFKPDAHMKSILEDAIKVANAVGRVYGMAAGPGGQFRYYENSAWWNMLFDGGYSFITPPPKILDDGSVEEYPSDGAIKLSNRTSMFYTATGITPAMCMRLIGIGSQYLIGNLDSKGKPFDGSKTYKLELPANIPARKFWSITLYDNQTRSMLQTDQRWPRAGSQNFPSPAAEQNEDGSTTLYFGPEKPADVPEGNFVMTDPDQGWFCILRFYFPEKGFFDKSWRAGEVELIE